MTAFTNDLREIEARSDFEDVTDLSSEDEPEQESEECVLIPLLDLKMGSDS